MRACVAVHPRVCGEHNGVHGVGSIYDGSSPRVRGTFHGPFSIYDLVRFIPACAGNIPLPLYDLELYTVHPRVCGEHSMAPLASMTWCGSSPRVRGTSRYPCMIWNCIRFIPACAGNISHQYNHSYCTPVHPRVCGEHRGSEAAAEVLRGSSPRVRGT